MKRAIDHRDVRHAALRVAADAHAVAEAVSAVGDEHVGRVAAAGEIVVAHADVAVLDQNIFPFHIARVRVVARTNRIGRGRRADGHAAHNHVLTFPTDGNVTHRRIRQRDALDQQSLAARRRNHFGTPDLVRGFHKRPPGRALTVNRAAAGDGDIVQLVAADERLAARIFSQRQHPQQRAGIEMQIDFARELDRSAQINSGRNFHHAAARRACGRDGGLNRLAVCGHAVAHRAVVLDVENFIGNHRRRGIHSSRNQLREQQRAEAEHESVFVLERHKFESLFLGCRFRRTFCRRFFRRSQRRIRLHQQMRREFRNGLAQFVHD